jgi:predicted RNA-binding protein
MKKQPNTDELVFTDQKKFVSHLKKVENDLKELGIFIGVKQVPYEAFTFFSYKDENGKIKKVSLKEDKIPG